MEEKKLRNAFLEHVKSGALAEAEEVTATLLEFMFLQRNFGQGVSDTLVAQFCDNDILRAPPSACN